MFVFIMAFPCCCQRKAAPGPQLLSQAQTNLNTVPCRSQTLCNFCLASSSPVQLTYTLRISLCQRSRAPALAAEKAFPLFTPILLVRQALDNCVEILLHRPRLCHVPPLQSSHAAQRVTFYYRDFVLRPLRTLHHDTFHPLSLVAMHQTTITAPPQLKENTRRSNSRTRNWAAPDGASLSCHRTFRTPFSPSPHITKCLRGRVLTEGHGLVVRPKPREKNLWACVTQPPER
jgi:hypothetical protein